MQSVQEVSQFVSGDKFVRLNEIVRVRDGQKFKIGDKVKWDCSDLETFEENQFIGTLQKIFLIEREHHKGTFRIEVLLWDVMPHHFGGRLDLNDIELLEAV